MFVYSVFNNGQLQGLTHHGGSKFEPVQKTRYHSALLKQSLCISHLG